MSAGFHKIFWGFLLVFLKIHIVNVDILPDPLGYFLIFQGIKILLMDGSGDGKRAKWIAAGLIFLSIPSVFMWNNAGEQPAMLVQLYGTALSLLKLVLVFHVFRMVLEIAIRHGQSELKKRVASTFNTYMAVLLPVTIAESFLMNMSGDWLTAVSIVLIIAAVVMEIVFLVLLRALMKHPWEIAEA
ncbi:hypothetical protein ACFFJY_14680 [Fictibacillus aquaticus]|uniref:Uncharacterized protein n=1 Tax=Fictibacillus aquaticus TaxID=2021314 RepID=A0A235FDM6_9BACL|nr:hypothetical protein [Fictibacillus aquaticus]OYD59458.1 hypothetical protein CGZ90_06095 [Fictibacillus aquaticus]